MEHVLLKTKWGWVALVGSGDVLHRLHLPVYYDTDGMEPAELEKARAELRNTLTAELGGLPPEAPGLLPDLQRQILDYFNGARIDNWACRLDFSSYPAFTAQVLQATATIPYGKTATYGQLAQAVGSPRASRAVGQVMAKNSIPLVIPCHRVLAHNGIGGFSSPGGLKIKNALLRLESKS